jgi:hypothetical protein
MTQRVRFDRPKSGGRKLTDTMRCDVTLGRCSVPPPRRPHCSPRAASGCKYIGARINLVTTHTLDAARLCFRTG